MGVKSERKRCRDCRKMRAGTPGKVEWCDCGGELVTVMFSRQRRKARGTGGHKAV